MPIYPKAMYVVRGIILNITFLISLLSFIANSKVKIGSRIVGAPKNQNRTGDIIVVINQRFCDFIFNIGSVAVIASAYWMNENVPSLTIKMYSKGTIGTIPITVAKKLPAPNSFSMFLNEYIATTLSAEIRALPSHGIWQNCITNSVTICAKPVLYVQFSII